jgi:hypothetical protein
MRTYDVVMLALLGIWWLLYRKKYERNAVVLYYIGGVFFADAFCALLIALMYKQNPAILSAPGWLTPIGGVAGLLYGATKGRLAKRNPTAQ